MNGNNAQMLKHLLRRKLKLDNTRRRHLQECCTFHTAEIQKTSWGDAHKTHPGRQKQQTALRMVAWWPGMSEDIEPKMRDLSDSFKENTIALENSFQVARSWHIRRTLYGLRAHQRSRRDLSCGWNKRCSIEAFPIKDRTALTVQKCMPLVFTIVWVVKTLQRTQVCERLLRNIVKASWKWNQRSTTQEQVD